MDELILSNIPYALHRFVMHYPRQRMVEKDIGKGEDYGKTHPSLVLVLKGL